MDGSDLFVLGGGGHAKVVIATLQATGLTPRGIFDDDPARRGATVLGVPVVGAMPRPGEIAAGSFRAIQGIGDNRVRQRLAERYAGLRWLSAVHPQAIVHESARIGEGSVVFAGAVIQPDVRVGRHAIVNTNASVDHDGAMGDFTHVAPGCALGGGVVLEEGAFLGIGARAIPYSRIGAWAVVGAGGVVVAPIPAGAVAVGVPARPIRQPGGA